MCRNKSGYFINRILISVFSISCCFFCFHTNAQSLSVRQVYDKMMNAIDGIETLRFKLKKTERINDDLKAGEQDVKFNRRPMKVYTYIHAPNKGVEVLYLEGQNNGDAYINPNAFPYINLNLDPYGSVMRKGNHHTVFEVGFDYIKKIVSTIGKNNLEKFDDVFYLDGEVNFEERECYKLVIDYPDFRYLPYKVKEAETLTDIAYRLNVSDYMLWQVNKKEVDSYTDVQVGQTILIPNAYAKKTILYIDKQTYLPIVQIMYDEKRLFEHYEFYNVIINSKIAEEEFSRDNDDYGF